MTCRFRDCTREAHKGWTTCAKHHSAGTSAAHDKKKKKKEKPRADRFRDCR